MEDGILVF